MNRHVFKEMVWDFYQQYGRTFAWRNVDDPYAVVVSEIMLQQTQTYRVEQKYEQFLVAFPDFNTLAHASLRDVLAVWQGLGYNRRGKYLHEIAKKVMTEFNGVLPHCPDTLTKFSGIGPNTAGSIVCFAFNTPTIFIETNIRAVYIHHFFSKAHQVSDKELMPIIQRTVDRDNPREWYYALMDYGVYLKKQFKNPARKSLHHTTQSTFEGSDRQIRGMIIRLLTQEQELDYESVLLCIAKDRQRVVRIIDDLLKEKMIYKRENILMIR